MLNHKCKQKWRKKQSPHTVIPLFEASWGPPVPPAQDEKKSRGIRHLPGPKGSQGSCEIRQLSCRTKSNHISGLSEVDCVLLRLESVQTDTGLRVRPVSLGSGYQNWKTAPPLASGHLNERSAPGDTGNPCSIFRKDSRNPEDR